MKKFVILNKEDIAVAVFSVSETDYILQALVAGLMSDPEIVEIDVNSKAGFGWKYINGEAVDYAN
jgi:hypothetical protein